MKKQFPLLLVLAVLLTSMVVSCKKDKKDTPDPTPKNEFSYENKQYDLTKGFQESYEANTGLSSFDVDITLTSSSINYSSDFNGKGDLIYLDLNTSIEGELVDGTYNFSSVRNAFTIVDGVVGVDFDIEAETGTTEDVIGGQVIVKTVDGKPQLEFELVLSGNRKVTGFYNGSIIKVD